MNLNYSKIESFCEGLDHPESICIDEQGMIYAGGEAGQIYRISPHGKVTLLATTGGFILGLALDGDGAIHACDCAQGKVWKITPDGSISERSSGTPQRPLTIPNHPAFDCDGNMFVTDSGDYWSETGTGCLMRIDRKQQTTLFHEGPFRFANGLAVDPTNRWLYIAQSTAANIVRVPISETNGPIEVMYQLPPGTVPDGLAFAADGQLLIGCYKPDGIFIGRIDGSVELLVEDPTGELLNRPTNIALAEGRIYVANLGGWHISVLKSELLPCPLHRPRFG
ncbi:SMP-30/gluconolactonase/LRE family protein [Blastopirellula sp. J2-11]|uniref:SMP-30/gluconolactonase/LRE family protein n=1 Tax=Blastopirellula sp. J2-11 TaxID=2943192 RepID=UPI0021C71ECC|nr:SMP-30/gluconolactonase/LRE family protein [Blastopirellula sp. J2-11]UUO04370.1 SMP-30/gluconolactonase/LRE family protein [Blastopirellula sp. J2-11]